MLPRLCFSLMYKAGPQLIMFGPILQVVNLDSYSSRAQIDGRLPITSSLIGLPTHLPGDLQAVYCYQTAHVFEL
jgi:hypothetical protein